MTAFFAFLLAAHVILGLFGVIAAYATRMLLGKREVPIAFARFTSMTSFVSLFLSWFTGGWYYAFHYGKAVKNVIQAGPYPWAHAIGMETKEHIFLFLPFLALIICLGIWILGDQLNKKIPTKTALSNLASVLTILGMAMALVGTFISGAVRS